MHPLLAPDKHPQCREKFQALMKCHAEHPIANLWGACNEDLHNLVKCCREEKRVKRAANVEKAKKDRERLMEKLQKRKGADETVYAPGYGVGTAVNDQPAAQ